MGPVTSRLWIMCQGRSWGLFQAYGQRLRWPSLLWRVYGRGDTSWEGDACQDSWIFGIFVRMILKLLVMPMLFQVFKSMDKDGSGTITKEEFLKICKNLSKEQVALNCFWEVIDGKVKVCRTDLILTTEQKIMYFFSSSKMLTFELKEDKIEMFSSPHWKGGRGICSVWCKWGWRTWLQGGSFNFTNLHTYN